jgi:transmembrane sensor
MAYDNYGVADFAKDPFFQRWVIAPDTETDRFWSEWLHENPDKQFVIEEAKRIIQVLGFTTDTHLTEKLLATWERVDDAWSQQRNRATPAHQSVYHFRYKVAAAFAMLLVSAITVWYVNNRKVTVNTGFSEIKSINLPDGSVVDVNANSTIAYLPDWNGTKEREVWLEGEAFFSVSHDEDKRFIVHTSGGIDIKVLGTTFNVMKRRNTTRVSLNTGKIQVHLSKDFSQRDEKTTDDDEGFIMMPGEVAEFDVSTRKVKRTAAKAEDYASWKQRKMVFDNTAMKDVAVILQDIYGVKVFLDKTLKMRRITGEFASDDLGILLEFIARALDARVTRNADEIRFKSKKIK